MSLDWQGPAGGERLAAALEGSPLAEIADRALPLSPAAVSALLFCAGLWTDAQWMRGPLQSTFQPDDSGPAGARSAAFHRAKKWRETHLLTFADWEQLADFRDGQSRTVAMEFCGDGAEEVVELPAARSRSLGVTLASAVLIRVPQPAFVTFWGQGRTLTAMGVPAGDVSRLETLVGAFAPRWLGASSLPDAEAEREKARLALAWAQALLDVRARDLRRRGDQGSMTATAMDRWEQVSDQLTADLKALGWSLAGAADLPGLLSTAKPDAVRSDAVGPDDRSFHARPIARIRWPIPSVSAGRAPRWVRPPVLPISRLPGEGDGGDGSSPGAGGPVLLSSATAEVADPSPAPSTWHDLILAATWKADHAGLLRDSGLAAGLWAAADELHQRHAEAALNGPDAPFKQAVIERFWEPLYALAHRAFCLGGTPDQAGRAWLNELKQLICVSADLVVLGANQTEASRFRSPAPGDPAGRPAVVDGPSRETVSFGILSQPVPRAPSQPTRAAASLAAGTPLERSIPIEGKRVAVEAGAFDGVRAGAKPPVTPRPRGVAAETRTGWASGTAHAPVRAAGQTAPSAESFGPACGLPCPGAEESDAELQSIWHVLVRRLFEDRRRLLPGRLGAGEGDRRRQLMERAGEIDRQQQQFVIDLPDPSFKARVAEEFFKPLCALALECYGASFTSRDPDGNAAPDAGAAWLNEMHQALGLAQLQICSPLSASVEKRAEWFQDPLADELSGRPAVFDIESGQLIQCGTRLAPL